MPVTYSYAMKEDLMAYLRLVLNNEPIEQAFENSPTLRLLQKKPVKLEGNYIQVQVSHVGTAVGGPYAANSTRTVVDVESAKVAQFEGAWYDEPAVMTKIEADKTKGSRALFDLWAFKVKQARLRLFKKMATDLFASSTPTNGLTPIPVALPNDNTTGTWGLSRSTYSWWRHYSDTSVGSWATNGPTTMDLLSLNIQVDGGAAPDVYVTTKTIFQYMKKSARSTNNFETTYTGRYKEKFADWGISAISFEGKPVIWDPYCDSGKVYAWREDALFLGEYEPVNVGEVVNMEPAQHAHCVFAHWAGNLLTNEPRRCGVASGITA